MLARGCPWANYHQSVILSSLEISSSDVNIGPDLHLQLVFHSNCPSDVFILYPVGFLSSRKTTPKLNVTSSPIFFFRISYLQEWLCHPCRLTPTSDSPFHRLLPPGCLPRLVVFQTLRVGNSLADCHPSSPYITGEPSPLALHFFLSHPKPIQQTTIMALII